MTDSGLAVETAVQISAGDDCVPWDGALDRDGYPRAFAGGRAARGHCLAWEQVNGPVPPGMVVRHSCDNRSCVNPDHLLLGTHADNQADKVERHRQAKGSGNGRAKLTEDDVVTLRRAHAEGWPVNELGRLFGISHKAVRLILDRKTWRHI